MIDIILGLGFAVAFNYYLFMYFNFLIVMYIEGKYPELNIKEADLENVNDLMTAGRKLDSFLLHVHLQLKEKYKYK